jgi:hypothetical protein
MPRMQPELDVLRPKSVLFGLVAAGAALAGAPLLAVVGQGVGALLGGCGWIGISTPIDRQVWALVNQPTVAFASQARSLGYWSGSTLILLAVALAAVSLLPRPRTLAAELVLLQAAWAATVVGLAWLPLVDLRDGHLWRWLELWQLPSTLAWAAPALAIPAAVSPTLRLLALLRMSRHHAGRALRLAAVLVHLGLPAGAWAAVATAAHGAPLVEPTVAVGAVVMVGLTVAWFGYPPPFVHRLEGLSAGSWLRLALAAAVLAGTTFVAGRPLPADCRAGLLWAGPRATNNIRPWIAATELRDLDLGGHHDTGASP